MCSVELRTGECEGRVVVVLRGELDVSDAASVAAALTAVAASGRQIIVDLAGLEFIDSSGLAALARARKHVRDAGGDLLLAAPQQQVLRVLAVTRLIEVFSIHGRVEDAASAGRPRLAPAPATGRSVVLVAT
jgi:anti-sigma B factor antagonist